MGHNTGLWSYESHGDGLCCFDTAKKAVDAAKTAAAREGESVVVYTPNGEELQRVRADLPSHADRCERPEIFGFED